MLRARVLAIDFPSWRRLALWKGVWPGFLPLLCVWACFVCLSLLCLWHGVGDMRHLLWKGALAGLSPPFLSWLYLREFALLFWACFDWLSLLCSTELETALFGCVCLVCLTVRVAGWSLLCLFEFALFFSGRAISWFPNPYFCSVLQFWNPPFCSLEAISTTNLQNGGHFLHMLTADVFLGGQKALKTRVL